MLNILVTGCRGRMGQAVTAATSEDEETRVSGSVDLGDVLEEAIVRCDAVIDFTLPTFTDELIEAGHDDRQLAMIEEASKQIPIVHAPNFSVGVNTLFYLTRKTTEILGDGFDLEVIEMHHRHKKDAPSGTARRLAEILADVKNLSYDDDCLHGRHGDVGARTNAEIGVHSMRGGDVVGDHTVVYATDGERIELTHKASSRMTFANGSVRAAKWIAEQKKTQGLFDMQDVLGLK